LDNLYVADASCFVSSGAVNPALTIMANALRVGDHLLERLGVRPQAEARSITDAGISRATLAEPAMA
jgi:choline dehydrogenase-like flavoprotein